jgi:hypothetical protein
MRRTGRHLRLVSILLALAATATTGSLVADEVDVLLLSRDFTSLPRTLIIVSPVPQPAKAGGKLEIAERLGRIMTEELITSLQRELPAAKVVTSEVVPAQSEGLLLETRFSRLIPGSRAKRFWLGFGAGKSLTELSGEVRDSATGRLVARFTHARLSWCCGFGSNDHEIRTNLVNAANDIAAVVAGHFHADQSYTWLDSGPDAAAEAKVVVTTGRKGVLQIEASADHAEVSVDGSLVGTTPLEIRLDPGTHRVVVKKRGFQEWTRDVRVVDGGKQALWADLEEAPAARIDEGQESATK